MRDTAGRPTPIVRKGGGSVIASRAEARESARRSTRAGEVEGRSIDEAPTKSDAGASARRPRGRAGKAPALAG